MWLALAGRRQGWRGIDHRLTRCATRPGRPLSTRCDWTRARRHGHRLLSTKLRLGINATRCCSNGAQAVITRPLFFPMPVLSRGSTAIDKTVPPPLLVRMSVFGCGPPIPSFLGISAQEGRSCLRVARQRLNRNRAERAQGQRNDASGSGWFLRSVPPRKDARLDFRAVPSCARRVAWQSLTPISGVD